MTSHGSRALSSRLVKGGSVHEPQHYVASFDRITNCAGHSIDSSFLKTNQNFGLFGISDHWLVTVG